MVHGNSISAADAIMTQEQPVHFGCTSPTTARNAHGGAQPGGSGTARWLEDRLPNELPWGAFLAVVGDVQPK